MDIKTFVQFGLFRMEIKKIVASFNIYNECLGFMFFFQLLL
jgi:hypothetical protein